MFNEYSSFLLNCSVLLQEIFYFYFKYLNVVFLSLWNKSNVINYDICLDPVQFCWIVQLMVMSHMSIRYSLMKIQWERKREKEAFEKELNFVWKFMALDLSNSDLIEKSQTLCCDLINKCLDLVFIQYSRWPGRPNHLFSFYCHPIQYRRQFSVNPNRCECYKLPFAAILHSVFWNHRSNRHFPYPMHHNRLHTHFVRVHHSKSVDQLQYQWDCYCHTVH